MHDNQRGNHERWRNRQLGGLGRCRWQRRNRRQERQRWHYLDGRSGRSGGTKGTGGSTSGSGDQHYRRQPRNRRRRNRRQHRNRRQERQRWHYLDGRSGNTGGTKGTGGSTSAGDRGGGRSGSGGNAAGASGTGGSGAGGSSGSTGDGGTASGAPSAGCGKTPTLKNSPSTRQSKHAHGFRREPAIRCSVAHQLRQHPPVPAHPRLSRGYGGSDTEEAPSYFGLFDLSNNTTIFTAGSAVGGNWDATADLTFVDAILKAIEDDLCIDTSRVELEGFSQGGAMVATLACQRPGVFRAAVGHSRGGLTAPSTCQPIPYLGSLGLVGCGREFTSNPDRSVRQVERVHGHDDAAGVHWKPRLHELHGLPSG